jgi:hypothetical protein
MSGGAQAVRALANLRATALSSLRLHKKTAEVVAIRQREEKLEQANRALAA